MFGASETIRVGRSGSWSLLATSGVSADGVAVAVSGESVDFSDVPDEAADTSLADVFRSHPTSAIPATLIHKSNIRLT
ncbi:MAG: hypothetical protein ABEK29_11165 [Bradymonadaceae bacterium]